MWLARERASEGSERSSRRAEEGVCAAHSRSGAPCFTFILTTNMIACQPIILSSEFDYFDSDLWALLLTADPSCVHHPSFLGQHQPDTSFSKTPTFQFRLLHPYFTTGWPMNNEKKRNRELHFF